MDLKKCVRVIEDFPKEGISFKDITTLLKDGKALKYTIDKIVEDLKDKNIDIVVGPEARGFLILSKISCNSLSYILPPDYPIFLYIWK